MNKNKYFPTCISNGKAKSIPRYVWNSCCCQKINSQSGWGISLYCGSITQILVSVTAVRNPLPAEEKKTNCTLFLQRHNIFPQKNNYLNIPAENLNSLSNLRFLQYVSKDKMKSIQHQKRMKMYSLKKWNTHGQMAGRTLSRKWTRFLRYGFKFHSIWTTVV